MQNSGAVLVDCETSISIMFPVTNLCTGAQHCVGSMVSFYSSTLIFSSIKRSIGLARLPGGFGFVRRFFMCQYLNPRSIIGSEWQKSCCDRIYSMLPFFKCLDTEIDEFYSFWCRARIMVRIQDRQSDITFTFLTWSISVSAAVSLGAASYRLSF